MTPERYKIVSRQIESIAEKGCDQVTELLNKAETSNNNIKELSEFSRTEIDMIIDELNQIMTVYENKHKDKPEDKV